MAVVLILFAWMGDAPQVAAPAWIVRSVDDAAVVDESRSSLLDTPILPGSVIKVVTLAAALEKHIIEPDTARLCRRVSTVGGRRYVCSHPDVKRPMTPAEALAHSCNDFFVSLAPRLTRTAINDVRARVGLPLLGSDANLAASLVGLDGPRVAPRLLLDVVMKLLGPFDLAQGRKSVTLSASTRRVLVEGLRGAATYGSASELASRDISALAKTGTAPMPGGGTLGLVLALAPADRPRRALIVVAPGAAGRDATSIAGDLLAGTGERVRVGMIEGQTTRVETLSLEEYVARVVAGEGRPRAPAAAQQALAIAARTFALANRGRHAHDGFDLCDTTHFQVIRASTEGSTRAAETTAGLLLAHNGKPAKIFYSAWCGGRGELASSVWPGAVDYGAIERGREDDACRDEPAWTSELAVDEIEHALRASGRRGNQLLGLRILARSPAGRVARLALDGFTPAEMSGEDFRMAVGRSAGWQRLKSTAFEARRSARGYLFTGRGSGHGVGMCLIGAAHRSARGATAADILAFYYPGLRIERSALRAPPPVTDVLLALPVAEERERDVVTTLIRRSRDEIVARAGVAAPATIRMTVHPSADSFGRAAGQPWWVSGATAGTAIDLLPVTVLKRRGLLERTIRHEVAHVVLDPHLAGKSLWVREGAAFFFTGSASAERSTGDACPADAELRRPASAAAHRKAYARADACFRLQISSGRTWRDVE